MPEEPDFDTEVLTAWSDFTRRLDVYLESMQASDTLTVCTGGGKSDHRHEFALIVTRVDTHVVADATIGGSLVATMCDEVSAMLSAAGWRVDDTTDEQRTKLAREGDAGAVAESVTILLRDFRGVTHPSFLAASETGASPASVFDTDPVAYPQVNRFRGEGEVDRAHARLTAEVHAALESIMGQTPAQDHDGDIQFLYGSRAAYLRILESAPVVELFVVFPFHRSCQTVDVAMSEFAASWPDIKFQADAGHVIASARVDCSPVVEEHLGRKLGMFLRFVEEQGDELAGRLAHGASGFVTPPALLTLLHLGVDTTHPLTPEDVALICNNDRGSILEYLEICSLERSRRETSPVGGKYDAELWDSTAALLRSALRFVVLTLARGGSEN